MRLSFFLSFLLIVAACAPLPQGKGVTQPVADKTACSVDSDCVCGGIDRNTNDCFVGNKEYAKNNVDFTRDCPDFCSGIAGHFETRCVSNKCQNVMRKERPVTCTLDAKVCPDGSVVGRVGPDCEFAPCPGDEPAPAECTKELHICPDGTGVGRTGPNCEFAPCPEPAGVDLSDAHWQCEDGSWRNNPEQCFENTCVSNSDCQVIGVKGICGPYKIVAPKSMHRPPVFYEHKCGSDKCSVITAMCAAPEVLPVFKNTKCEQGRCIGITEPELKECETAQDCVPNSCCHPTSCVPRYAEPNCAAVSCTANCEPGTLDCGGSCGCVNNKCVGVYA